jgi:hypothetical protein
MEKAVPHLPVKELYITVEILLTERLMLVKSALNRKEKVSRSVCDTFWSEALATRLYKHSITNLINVRLLSTLQPHQEIGRC